MTLLRHQPGLTLNPVLVYLPPVRFPGVVFFGPAQSEEYFINKRGHVIHFRSYLPHSADAIKAVVLFSHG